ncbi:XRE family transcriptional regulator [Candidatus Marinamargulisbacteria bacterium SCGC AAA071-K20]|nr:XRE family transcriptional regulator [Candidatus Marinamargulisbacteria bacterium SCGC AAA071-K20]
MKILVKDLRKHIGHTQELFSSKAGISIRYLQNIERGDHIPSLTILEKIAKAHGVSIKDLIDD